MSQEWSDKRAREFLRRLLDVAVATADPRSTLRDYLPPLPRGRCVVVGAGKAAASMAVAVEQVWPLDRISGSVVVPYGYGMSTSRITVLEAGHPVPDANSEAAGRAIMDAVRGLGPQDLVLVLISGGGSSVMAVPSRGLTLADKQFVNRRLLASGLDIRTMNAVRRRMSAIKGGKLAALAAPAQVVTLAVSDIPGDDLSYVASGPSLPDTSAEIDLSAAVKRLGADLPAHVAALLNRPDSTQSTSAYDARVVSAPGRSLEAAAAEARAHGVETIVLGDDIEGEAEKVGKDMARVAMRPVDRPTVYISGGETTVTLDGSKGGRGGRNTEFALSFAVEAAAYPGVWAIAADTDGEDGASGAAGAIVTPSTIGRGLASGLDCAASQRSHDSASYFGAIGDLVVTGPTYTNVNDFRAVLVLPADSNPSV